MLKFMVVLYRRSDLTDAESFPHSPTSIARHGR